MPRLRNLDRNLDDKMMATADLQNGRKNLLTLDQRNSSSDLFISISGLIGAGKTTLAERLAEKMNLPCFHEPVIDNTYLADFYKDSSRYSFPLQVSIFLPSGDWFRMGHSKRK